MNILPNAVTSPNLNSIIKSLIHWIIFIAFLFMVGSFVTPFIPDQWDNFVYGILGTVLAFLSTRFLVKSEKKTFADYELVWQKTTISSFLKGLGIGTLLFAFLILIVLLFTDLYLQRNTEPWSAISMLGYLTIFPLALMEEVAFRSYSFINLNKIFGLRITQVIVAIAFASYHIVSGWDVLTAFLGPGIWAFVFGLAAIRSNGIALPLGIHVSLNAAQELLGMKGGTGASIWLLTQAEHATSESIARSEFVGIITQILVLAGAIVFTEIYIRKSAIVHRNIKDLEVKQ